MIDTKKPAKPTPVTSAKPTTANSNTTERRPSLPPLSPLPDEKLGAGSVQPATPAAANTASEKASEPASAEPQATTTPAPARKPVEKLGPKLRKRDDILKALRAGAKVMKVDGLFRIVASDGTKNATSKRRILSLESQKLLVASADGNSFALDVAADKKAQEPKAAPVAKPATEEKK